MPSQKAMSKKKLPSKRGKKLHKKNHKTSTKKVKITKSSLKKIKSKSLKTVTEGNNRKQNLQKDKYFSLREAELKKIMDKEKTDQLILKDMEGRTYCAVENCDYPALVKEYCRIHFFGLFKFIKQKERILDQDILEKSYMSLINKYSETVFDYLFKDLASDKDFQQALKKITGEEHHDFSHEEMIFNEKTREVTKF